MSDEEKKAIEYIKNCLDNEYDFKNATRQKDKKAYNIILNLIEKQSKEIEELKDDRKKYAEEYIHNNPWLFKQLNENYILRVESEQKEKQAYIDGTNVAHELCNKKWKDKIKAKIEELEKGNKNTFIRGEKILVLQSLLEKE